MSQASRVEEGVADGPVVDGPDPVARVPGTERAGVTEEFAEPRHGPDDFGELLGEPDLLYRQVGGEQGAQGRVPPEQLVVEPGGQGGQLRPEASE
jgi:hypothetical protein